MRGPQKNSRGAISFPRAAISFPRGLISFARISISFAGGTEVRRRATGIEIGCERSQGSTKKWSRASENLIEVPRRKQSTAIGIVRERARMNAAAGYGAVLRHSHTIPPWGRRTYVPTNVDAAFHGFASDGAVRGDRVSGAKHMWTMTSLPDGEGYELWTLTKTFRDAVRTGPRQSVA